MGTRGKAAAEIRQLRGEPEADPYLLLHDGDSFFCVDEVTFRPDGQQAGGEIMVSGKLAFANAVAVGALALSFCTSAAAADLTRRPPPPLMPVYTWNGFYVGGFLGGVTSSETATDPFGFTV